MRKHPLLAFVTAIITCSIPGAVTVAKADTLSVEPLAVDQTTVQTVPAATVQQHRARAHNFNNLRAQAEARAKAKARHLHQLRVAAQARNKRHRHLIALAKATAKAREASLAKQRAKAKLRAAVAHPYTALGGVWASLRHCESQNNYATNTGNGYYGAYQFSTASWRAVGGSGLPSAASPQVQDAAAKALYSRQGWHAWPTCSWRVGLA
jgi:hypothetical protein